MRFLHVSSLLLLSLTGLGCTTTAAVTTITRPELVQVSPEDFLGTQKCGAGAVRSYVATLFDVTADANGNPLPETQFPLPSSPPTPCNFPVTFSYVLVDHRYRAEVDAYDLPTQAEANQAGTKEFIQAVSLGGRLQENAEGVRVAPRWKASCGGYPPAPADGGDPEGPDAQGGQPILNDAGDAGVQGVVSYDYLTTTVHDCQNGLVSAN